jgi:hypothetical protein
MNINRKEGIATGVQKNVPNREEIIAELLEKGFISHSFVSTWSYELRFWSWSCDILRKKG